MTPNPNYTSFLRELVRSSGISIRDLADEIDVTPASIQHWLSFGNISLSRLLSIVDVLGYEFEIAIGKKPSLDHEEPSYTNFSDIDKMSLPKLHFLSWALNESGITKKVLAERMGLTRDAVTYWFGKKNDDITIRNLVSVANAFGMDIYMRFVAKKPLSETPSDSVGIHVTIVKHTSNYIENASSEE